MDIALTQDMSFLALIAQASWVVKGVMLLLLFASAATESRVHAGRCDYSSCTKTAPGV